MTLRPNGGVLVLVLCAALSRGVARGGDAGPSTAVAGQPPLPNLRPQSPSTAPLLRKINLEAATRILPFYCAGVAGDQVSEVQVPPFDWGVGNDGRSPVNQPFVVVLAGGASKSVPLSSRTVQSIPQSGMRIFRNWPGRPARVKVINVTRSNPRLASEYDGTPGCYIPTAFAGQVALDPKPLIIRVDDGARIEEWVETDNELIR